jgi:hypothetical protein
MMPAQPSPRSIRIRVLDPSRAASLVGQGLLMVVVTCWTFQCVWLNAGAMGFLLAAMGLGLLGLVGRAEWESMRLEPGVRDLWLLQGGRRVRGIAYQDIASYQFGAKGEAHWLRIVLRSGEVALEIPGRSIIPRRDRVSRALIRGMGPHLPEDSAHSRVVRPGNAIEGLLYDHFQSPPAISMQSGVVYRYVSPPDFRAFLKRNSTARWAFCTVLTVVLLSNHVFDLLLDHAALFSLVLIVVVEKCVSFVMPIDRFIRSLNDRFEVVGSGLRVTRGRRSWTLHGAPAPSVGLGGRVMVADLPILRYGWGLGAYYFDPRFIEVDT